MLGVVFSSNTSMFGKRSAIAERMWPKMWLLGIGDRVPYPWCMANFDHLELFPHPAHDPAPKSRLRVALFTQREAHAIRLNAQFTYEPGPGEALKIAPLRERAPGRFDGLWETTCFELFLQPEAAMPSYWEVNFSPRGDWNVYALDGYREGLREEPGLEEVRADGFEAGDEGVICSFSFEVPGPSGLILGPMRLSATAVIETEAGQNVLGDETRLR